MFGNIYDTSSDENAGLNAQSYKVAQLDPRAVMVYGAGVGGGMMGQGLGQMMGGQSSKQRKQAALQEIMSQFPKPTTPEDFMEVAHALQEAGFNDLANKTVELANDVRASMPTNASEQRSTYESAMDTAAQFVQCAIDSGGWEKSDSKCKAEVFKQYNIMKRGDELGNMSAKVHLESIIGKTDELSEIANTASSTLQTLGIMDSLLNSGVKTGFSEKWLMGSKQLLDSIGFDTGVAGTEAFNALAHQKALDQLTRLSGAASDKDIDFITAGGPELGKTVESNKLLIDYQRHLARKSVELSKYMSDWAEANPAATSWEFESKQREWANRPENNFNLEDKHNNLVIDPDSQNQAKTVAEANDAYDQLIEYAENQLGSE